MHSPCSVKGDDVVRQSSERKGWGRGGSGGRGKNRNGGEQFAMSELKRELDMSKKELKELRERKSSLERECVIYQSQLEVRVQLTTVSCDVLVVCVLFYTMGDSKILAASATHM